jgi:NADH-quinone oxidoreductase subunit C/D
MYSDQSTVIDELNNKFGQQSFVIQPTQDEIPTLWVSKDKIKDVLST